MMQVMCSKDPTVRCCGQCDDPQCVTNSLSRVTVSYSCPKCADALAQIEALQHLREDNSRLITNNMCLRSDLERAQSELAAAKRDGELAKKMCVDAEAMLAADQYDECWSELHQFNDCVRVNAAIEQGGRGNG